MKLMCKGNSTIPEFGSEKACIHLNQSSLYTYLFYSPLLAYILHARMAVNKTNGTHLRTKLTRGSRGFSHLTLKKKTEVRCKVQRLRC